MDWDLAIKRNSKALKGIIEVLFALLGLDGTEAASRIPRSLHSAVLGVLRPAESAVRRLIVIAARNVVVKLAALAVHARRPQDREGWWKQVSLLPALRSAQTFEAHSGHESHPACPAHPFHRLRSKGCEPCFQHPGRWLSPRRRPMAWPVQRAFTAGSRLSSLPSMTFPVRPSASSACSKGGSLAGLQVHGAAPLRPSTGLPPETHSPIEGRRSPRQM